MSVASAPRITVAQSAGAWHADLPDGLGHHGPADDETVRAIASRIELFLVSRQTRYVVLHAGVVEVDGVAIVLPGPSFAGKSTLVTALVAAGATYLSDEYAPLTDDGRVAPYPRPITVRGDDGRTRRRVEVPDAAPPDADPVPVGLVAVLTRSTEGGWDVRPLPPAQAVLAMVANGVNARRLPERSLTALTATAERARAVTGTRGEAADAADELIRLVRG